MTTKPNLQPVRLDDDQKARIEATLKRIRTGLGCSDRLLAPEPAHIFLPHNKEAKRS